MTEISYEDIVDAQIRAVRDNKQLSYIVLDKPVVESMKDNMQPATYVGDDDAETPAEERGFQVHSGDGNVLVTEDGTEYEI